MKKSKEARKAIKRPFKFSNVNQDTIDKLNDAIERTNLFITNIFNFVKTYYISSESTNDLSIDDLYEIFLILRDADDYENKDTQFYQFYSNKFKSIYFNPINKGKPLDGSYLNQVIKNNITVMLTAIENNIIYTHEKYVNRLIKSFISNICKDDLEYNSLIKKCSIYECYSDIPLAIIDELKQQKNNFKPETLKQLLGKIGGYKKVKHIYRKKDNIFNEKIKEIKLYEIELNKIKSNIKKFLMKEIDDSTIIPSKFHEILKLKDKVIPVNENYDDELTKNPFNFIQSMIYMNNYFEKNKVKTFNVFPSRSNVIPKNITLDTASISVIFCNNSYPSVEKYKKEIYQKVFKFPESYFKLKKKYTFTGTIQTDGISLSLLYMKNEDYEKKLKTDKLKNDGKNELLNNKKEMKEYENSISSINDKIKQLSKKEKENKTELLKLKKDKKNIENKIQEIENKIDEKNKIKKEKEKEQKEKEKQAKEKYKEYIKKLKEEKNEDELKKINRRDKEFYYLEDLIREEIEELDKNKDKILYVDQGKIELFYMLHGGKDVYVKYSGKERGRTIKTEQHRKKINEILKKSGIEKEYEELRELNKKSTNKEKIMETMKKINEINYNVYEACKNKKLREEKLEMYIDKQKAEKQMIEKIVKQLGLKNMEELKEYIIVIGDWEGNNKLKNNKSTKGIGMKRILRKYVKKMYLLDEYNTSKISNINYKEYGKEEKKENYICKNHRMELISECKKTKEKKVINKKMHAILTFKMEKKSIACDYLLHNEESEYVLRLIQRDKNAVNNFRTIVICILTTKKRPDAFTRNNGRR